MLTLPPFFTPFSLAWRNMRSRRGRTLLTLLGIILGVAVVLAIRITNESTLASIRNVFDRATGSASLLVVARNPNQETLSEDALERVADFPGVETAAASLIANSFLAAEADSWELQFSVQGVAEGSVLRVYGIQPESEAQVHVYELTAGRLPEEDTYEAALPETYAQEKGLTIGDDLVILTPGGTERLRIVGLLAEEGAALNNNGQAVFAPLAAVQEIFQRQGELDEIALRIEERLVSDPEALEELRLALNERLDPVGEAVYPASRGQLVGQMLATYQLGLTFFSLIAIFVGAFLIYNTFSMTVVERTREIGMLRAIGMSRVYILRMVLVEALILALIGSGLGILTGLFLARGLIRISNAVAATAGGFLALPWQGIVQGLVVGIGVTLLAALVPAIQAASTSPLQALQVRARRAESNHSVLWFTGLGLMLSGWVIIFLIPWRREATFAIGIAGVFAVFLGATMTVTLAVPWLERLAQPLARLLYRNEGRIGSANVSRAAGRTTLTVASLMVALTMIISIGSQAFSFRSDIETWIDNALGGDLYVRSPVPMRESFQRQLENIAGVEVASPGRYLRIRAAPGQLPADSPKDDELFFNAIDPETYRQIADVEFAVGQGDAETNWQRLEQGSAVFISKDIGDAYQLKQGDELVLLTNRGAHPFTVAAEIVDFAGEGKIVTGTYADLHRWFAEYGADRFTVKISPGAEVTAVAEEIEQRFADRRHISVQTIQDFKESIFTVMNQAFRLFDVLNLIGVIIGALGVINTLTMNVMERQREIGSLRSLGLTRSQVLRMVLAEALTLGIMGGIYGLGIGYLMAHILIRGTNLMIGYDLVFLFTARPFLIGILIALGIAQLAGFLPARRAAAVNIIEAIQHE